MGRHGGFVAAFGHAVEEGVRAKQLLEATAVGGIGMEDVAGSVFVEDAQAGSFVAGKSGGIEIVDVSFVNDTR